MRAGERLVGDHAQGVEVRPVVGRRVGRRLLRGHVRGRAHGQSERRRRAGGHRLRRGAALGGRGERLGDPEVGHHRVPAREQHVLGLEVAVHHALAVRVGEGVGQLAHEPHHIRDGQGPVAPKPLAQRLALHVGHRVVGQPVHVARGVDRHHVRVLEARDTWISRSKRAAERPAARSGSSTFTTRRRPRRVSRATNTRDMPPPPSSRSSV
jgi:hypothetical protein